jgi:hypothetical protein
MNWTVDHWSDWALTSSPLAARLDTDVENAGGTRFVFIVFDVEGEQSVRCERHGRLLVLTGGPGDQSRSIGARRCWGWARL